jgi:predicted nucleotide-binding protein
MSAGSFMLSQTPNRFSSSAPQKNTFLSQRPLPPGFQKALQASLLWSDGVFGASSFAIESLETQIGIADFAVLVVGPDDQVTSRGVASDAPRDNVVFEVGLFMGALSRSRTFLLAPMGRKVKIPTDLLGLTTLQFDPAASNPADLVSA